MSVPANQHKDSTHLSVERVEHRKWIGGRALTLLSHYWRDDDPVELTGAIGKDWADVLEGLPQEYIQRACIQYQREEERRKPTPGGIYQRARSFMEGDLKVTPHVDESQVEKTEPRVTADQTKSIFDEVGFNPKKFG